MLIIQLTGNKDTSERKINRKKTSLSLQCHSPTKSTLRKAAGWEQNFIFDGPPLAPKSTVFTAGRDPMSLA